jgi:hypothetical protein
VTGEFVRPNLDQEEIMTAATRFLKVDAVDAEGDLIAPTGYEHVGDEMAMPLLNEDQSRG